MPRVVPVSPPDPSKYGRVLRRYDRLPSLQIRYRGYDVNLLARPVERHGRVAATIFFPPGKEAAALRALKFGWKDETELFAAHVRGEPDPTVRPTPPLPPLVPTVDATRPVAGSAVRSSPDGMEPTPGIETIAARLERKRKQAATN